MASQHDLAMTIRLEPVEPLADLDLAAVERVELERIARQALATMVDTERKSRRQNTPATAVQLIVDRLNQTKVVCLEKAVEQQQHAPLSFYSRSYWPVVGQCNPTTRHFQAHLGRV
jgi:hypothetical protein